jgi:ATP-dependent DNA ligase
MTQVSNERLEEIRDQLVELRPGHVRMAQSDVTDLIAGLTELLSLRQSHSTGVVVNAALVERFQSAYRAAGQKRNWHPTWPDAEASFEILSALYTHPKEAEVTDSDLLAAMKEHVGWELDWGPEDRHDEERDFGWRVFERSGGRSDLEWTLLGFGETPRAALVAALSRKG